jgi:hypothetical protein
MPCPEVKDGVMFCVVMSAASLFAVKDDSLLRRIICHEFAHCFYLVREALLHVNFTDKKPVELLDLTGGLPKWLAFEDDLERDKMALVKPDEWFGQSDAKQFILGDDQLLDKSVERLKTLWIDRGLPVKTPNRRYRIGANEPLCIPEEIVEHIKKTMKGR